jgi:hypothetical protein
VDDPKPVGGADDAVLRRVSEVSLRILVNGVSRKTQDRVRALMESDPNQYPWQKVVDEVLAEPLPDDAVMRSLRAQRDYFTRAGVPASARVGRAARVASKTALAYVLARLIFFVIYTASVVMLLVLAKHRWPGFDIYRILEWLREIIPSLFGR